MTHEFDDVVTEEEFQRALSKLVSAAAANGVDVEGGWTCEANPTGEEWDVVISVLGSSDSTKGTQ
ncbi:hypothetical protein [Halospeciosus flavus]|uniref:Amphi-Trp domain-containing protein n=1 Tax=Halospeciosus flavus TaxID=3032283 RepID=A0ABD5Z6A6_9EURY